MGKGDKKTKRGKIIMGSYGNTRPGKKKNNVIDTPKPKGKEKEEPASKSKKG